MRPHASAPSLRRAKGERWWLRLHGKGGKLHEIPAHNKLEAYLDDYIRAANLTHPRGPLFCAARGKTGELSTRRMRLASSSRAASASD
jgi:hypothetical protein